MQGGEGMNAAGQRQLEMCIAVACKFDNLQLRGEGDYSPPDDTPPPSSAITFCLGVADLAALCLPMDLET